MFRRKLLVNLIVIFVCGTVVISVLVIAKHMDQTTNAAGQTDWELTSTLYRRGNDFYDYDLVWQVALKSPHQTIEWKDLDQNLFEYNEKYLQRTEDGFICLNVKTTADYQALVASGYTPVVTYCGYRCKLKIN